MEGRGGPISVCFVFLVLVVGVRRGEKIRSDHCE